MKKNILWALIALFAATFEVAAQNNSYNMVITMANGTTISIGPNEVKNISFNDGKVEMTGQTLNQLVERVEQLEPRMDKQDAYLQSQIDALAAYLSRISSCHCDANIFVKKTDIEELSSQVNTLKSRITSLYDRVEGLNIAVLDSAHSLRALVKDKEKSLRARYDELITTLESRIAVIEYFLSNEVKSATKKEDE